MITSPSAGPKRILIADDEPTLIFFLQQTLRQTEPVCTVDVAADGQTALQRLKHTPYDLLITDLKMPGENGLRLIELARTLYPGIKTILMTAYGSAEVQQKAAQLQVNGYLTKPFSTATLQKMALALLSFPDVSPAPRQP